jgi:maltose O-acetyltransferase
MNVTVLPGVTVGAGCVIAAGAVVASDLQPNGLYGGVPAKLIQELDVEPVLV